MGALKPGSKGNFEDSMAGAIQQAFTNNWKFFMNDQPMPAINDQMNLLFVSISEGVINYLSLHNDAFKVHIDPSKPSHDEEVQIVVEN